jgi:hypothetical protein
MAFPMYLYIDNNPAIAGGGSLQRPVSMAGGLV